MERPDCQAWFKAHPPSLHWKSPRLPMSSHPTPHLGPSCPRSRGRKVWQAQHMKASLAFCPVVWADQASGGPVKHPGSDPATHWETRCRAWATITKGRQAGWVGGCGGQGTSIALPAPQQVQPSIGTMAWGGLQAGKGWLSSYEPPPARSQNNSSPPLGLGFQDSSSQPDRPMGVSWWPSALTDTHGTVTDFSCPKQVLQPPPRCFGTSGFCPDAQT